jgi:hypothetical protein
MVWIIREATKNLNMRTKGSILCPVSIRYQWPISIPTVTPPKRRADKKKLRG